MDKGCFLVPFGIWEAMCSGFTFHISGVEGFPELESIWTSMVWSHEADVPGSLTVALMHSCGVGGIDHRFAFLHPNGR